MSKEAEQVLLNFDGSKENIPRQIMAIVPTRNIHTETGRGKHDTPIQGNIGNRKSIGCLS